MENLKSALTVLITVAEKTDNALEDGKISIAEGVSIGFSAIGLLKLIKDIKGLWNEYKELSDEEISDLSEWFTEEFDINDDNLETIIEMLFSSLLHVGEVFDVLLEKE